MLVTLTSNRKVGALQFCEALLQLKGDLLMIRQATEQDVATILEIINYNIEHSTALYHYEPQTYEQRLAWFKEKQQAGDPIFVYEEDGEVAGYATYGKFRPQPAYKYTVEHSIYVHHNHYKKGIASKLMETLIEYARTHEVKTMIGCIDATNEASIRAHEKLGFIHSGTLKNVGYKFGQWLDAAFYQLHFEGPTQPTED